jgi:hypothetical protein
MIAGMIGVTVGMIVGMIGVIVGMIAGIGDGIAGTIAGTAEMIAGITRKSGRDIEMVWIEGRKTRAPTDVLTLTTPAIIEMGAAITARDSAEATSSATVSTPTTADGERRDLFRSWRTEI